LDPTTAGIAAALYPSADIVTAGFEGPGWNEGTFSAAIGNVPFGNFKVYDPTFNPRGHSIHNHFLLKALRLTAPGGVLAMVTSTYTLDAASPAARRELHEHGDLLGAVRLGSHHRATAEPGQLSRHRRLVVDQGRVHRCRNVDRGTHPSPTSPTQ